MFRVLLFKELREAWWIGLFPLAMMLYCAAVETEFGRIDGLGYGFRHTAVPKEMHAMPLATSSFAVGILLWGGLLSGVLGLWQTFRESQSRTWHFLFHRPVSRLLILRAKMVAALIIFSLAIVVPVFTVCAWVATPGTHASPFHWSLIYPCVIAVSLSTVFYWAALFAGLRRGRLVGTRWWPLIGVTGWFGFGGMDCFEPSNLLSLRLQLLLCGTMLLSGIFLVAMVQEELRSADFN